MLQFRPLDDRVLVRPLQPEEVTRGGLIIPDTAKEKPQEGRVVAVGTDENLQVKVGDRILYAKYAGTEIKLNGEEHIVINRNDILGVFEEQPQ